MQSPIGGPAGKNPLRGRATVVENADLVFVPQIYDVLFPMAEKQPPDHKSRGGHTSGTLWVAGSSSGCAVSAVAVSA
jgi:hypothetical protein